MISVKDLHKSFGGVTVLDGISTQVERGDVVCIIGPSGSGKSTFLRCLIGLEPIQGGNILLKGKPLEFGSTLRSGIGMVFQSYDLFPHLTVLENILLAPLHVAKRSREDALAQAETLLKRVKLWDKRDFYPRQLSGGQKQRVSIARALINNPKVLLLDEPLGALDLNLRKQMQLELKTMQKKLGITFIYITHDQEEALTMSDRIAVMHKGILEQVCSPKELYMKPKTKYVAEFIGESNIFEGVVKDRNSDNCTVAIESGNILCSGDGYVAGQMVYVCIRPEKVRITRKAGSGNSLPAEIKEQIFTGNMMKHIAVLSNGHEIKVADIASYNDINIGDKVYLEWDAKDAVMIKNPTGPMAENFDTLRGVQ